MFEPQGPFQDPSKVQSSSKNATQEAQAQLDFEIDFFERILAKAPEYLAVLQAHANNLSAKGLHARGLAADRRIVELRPKDPIAYYNLACSYSLLQMSDAALDSLHSSLKLGYSDFQHVLDDPDLEYLRKDTRFPKLLGRFLQKALSPSKVSRRKKS